MAKKRNDGRVISKDGQTVAAPGYKMTLTPKKGDTAMKDVEVLKGAKKVNLPNAPYMPKPTTSAKKQIVKPAAKSKVKFKMGNERIAKSGRGYKIKTKRVKCN